jgi:putative transcriptional regulator
VEFEWDPVKASGNVEKHGVDFDTAAEIFDDPDLFVVIHSRTYGERRYQAIGASHGDWDRLNRMSDEEIVRAALDDPDAQPLSDEKLARGFRPKALTALRKRLGLSQAEFARQFMFNLRTLQDWEQGRRQPEGIARTYLRVIDRNPDAVRAALED